MSNEHTAYPLDWPPGWPRTKPYARSESPFWTRGYDNGRETKMWVGVAGGRERVLGELGRMGAQYAVISTNMPARLDGTPLAKGAMPDDPGVAVYFALKGKPHVLACDRWTRVGCNLAAIAKHIEALRGIDRWGVGSIERAFAGFTALPPPGASSEPQKRPWREILDVACPPNPDGPTREAFLMMAESRFKAAARKAHPDAGGSADAMAELNTAIEEARAELRGGT